MSAATADQKIDQKGGGGEGKRQFLVVVRTPREPDWTPEKWAKMVAPGQDRQDRLVVTDREGLLTALYGGASQQLRVEVREAASESELCLEMVRRNEHFDLDEMLVDWSDNEGHTGVHHCPLINAALADVDSDALWEDEATDKHRPWLTAALAERLWKIHNDPRRLCTKDPGVWAAHTDLGLNAHAPNEHLEFAQILPMPPIIHPKPSSPAK